jgi:hypothetical protein
MFPELAEYLDALDDLVLVLAKGGLASTAERGAAMDKLASAREAYRRVAAFHGRL